MTLHGRDELRAVAAGAAGAHLLAFGSLLQIVDHQTRGNSFETDPDRGDVDTPTALSSGLRSVSMADITGLDV
jgi:hypothetical protein